MKKLIGAAGLALLSLLAFAAPSFATSILLDHCNTLGLCDQVLVTTTLDGAGGIDVSVTDVPGSPTVGIFGDSGGNHAFGFNVGGSTVGLVISNFSAGFSYAGAGVGVGGPYGDFEYVIDGPHTGSDATLPLTFTVTRDGGFSSDADLLGANSDGYIFTAHVRNNDTGDTGWAAAGGDPSVTVTSESPEPATMLLMGTGLLGLATGIRRAKRRAAR
jgi:hypothetical protein